MRFLQREVYWEFKFAFYGISAVAVHMSQRQSTKVGCWCLCSEHSDVTHPCSFFTEASSNSDSGHEIQEDSSKENAPSNASCADRHPQPADDGKSHELSNLRLENQLLRNEVQSLNQEMASLLQRARETQEGRALFQSSRPRNLTFQK